MHFTVYETKNLLNGKVYIGVHETADPHDGYLGSGKILKAALRKHGRDSFQKRVLHDCATREEMFAREAELVTEGFVAQDNNYNLLPGGSGGWYRANQSLTYEQRALSGRKGGKSWWANAGDSEKRQHSQRPMG